MLRFATEARLGPQEVQATRPGNGAIAPIRRPEGQGKSHSFPTPEEMTSTGPENRSSSTAPPQAAKLLGKAKLR